MSQQILEGKLKVALEKLEETSGKIISTRGYTSENEKVRVMVEMIKEQLTNENSDNSAG